MILTSDCYQRPRGRESCGSYRVSDKAAHTSGTFPAIAWPAGIQLEGGHRAARWISRPAAHLSTLGRRRRTNPSLRRGFLKQFISNSYSNPNTHYTSHAPGEVGSLLSSSAPPRRPNVASSPPSTFSPSFLSSLHSTSAMADSRPAPQVRGRLSAGRLPAAWKRRRKTWPLTDPGASWSR